MPEQTSVTYQYASQNLQLQKRISNLKSQLRIVANRKWMARCRHAASEIEDLKEEGIRAQGERAEMIYRNNIIQNAQEIYVKIDTLANYLESLEWMLKSGMQMIIKKSENQ